MGNGFRKIMGVRGNSTAVGRHREANTCSCRSDNVDTPKSDWREQAEARNVVQSLTIDKGNLDNSAQPTSCLCGEDIGEPRDCISCGAERRLRELLESIEDEETTKLLEPSSQQSSSITKETSGQHPFSANAISESLEESKNEQSTSSEKKKIIKGLYGRLESLKSFCISGDCLERRRRTVQCACGRAGIYTYVIQS